VQISAGLPGSTWISASNGFWTSGNLPGGTWDFFFGPCKKTATLINGQTTTLNFP
jgi:hypothetical protein